MAKTPLSKIAPALERGSLPPDLVVHFGGVAYVVKCYKAGALDEGKTLRWFKRTFPGGAIARDRYNGQQQIGRRRVHTDAWRYYAADGEYEVMYEFLTPHVCFRWNVTEEFYKDGLPKWACADCTKPLPLAEARRRGLII